MDEFEWEFVQQETENKPERRYKFIIEFGLHCFTRGLNKHHSEAMADIPPSLHYSDSRETRIFCIDRHDLSYQLPDIAKSVDSMPCFNTGKGNFFVIKLTDYKGETNDYEVYFKVSKAGKGRLRLYVQSAYIRDSEHQSSQPKKKKIGFFIISHNTQTGKPIRQK